MRITLSPRVRQALYILTVIGTPVVVYLASKGLIGDLEVILWTAEVSAVAALAAFNVDTK